MSAQETEFFERVKKHINNKSTYNEFLKVLNLFSQQIVDQNTLVERVQSFIGNDKKLFKWFKDFVGYNGKDEIVENIPATASKPDYVQSKAYGQSYRLIPNSVSVVSSSNSRFLSSVYLCME
jgi:paired amphipathic helix protein Sin3a